MTDELITPQNLSQELIISILDAALITFEVDGDNEIKVTESIPFYIEIYKDDETNMIRLNAFFRLNPDADRLARLEAVNAINNKYLYTRADIVDLGDIEAMRLRNDIMITGGIPKRALVHAIKHFGPASLEAAQEFHNVRI